MKRKILICFVLLVFGSEVAYSEGFFSRFFLSLFTIGKKRGYENIGKKTPSGTVPTGAEEKTTRTRRSFSSLSESERQAKHPADEVDVNEFVRGRDTDGFNGASIFSMCFKS